MANKVTYDIRTSSDSAVLVQTNGDSSGAILAQYDEENDQTNTLIDADGNMFAPSASIAGPITSYLVKAGTGNGYTLTKTDTTDVEPHFNSQVYHISATQSFKLLASDDGEDMFLDVGVAIHNSHGSNTILITLDDAYVINSANRVVTLPHGGTLLLKMILVHGQWFITSALTSSGNSLSNNTLNYKGVWASGTTYIPNDVVTIAGSSYVSILAGINHQPPNVTYFGVLAQAGANGNNGAVGGTGPTGRPAGLYYQFSSDIINLPSTGKGISFNNATLASVTKVRFNNVNEDAVTVGGYIDTWDDSTSTVKGVLIIQKATDPSKYAVFSVSALDADPGSDGGHKEVTVSCLASGGSITDDSFVTVQFYRTGDAA